jgi:hypothetical protein
LPGGHVQVRLKEPQREDRRGTPDRGLIRPRRAAEFFQAFAAFVPALGIADADVAVLIKRQAGADLAPEGICSGVPWTGRGASQDFGNTSMFSSSDFTSETLAKCWARRLIV